MPSTCHTPPMPAYRVPETRRGLAISLPSDWQERHLTGPPSALPVSAIPAFRSWWAFGVGVGACFGLFMRFGFPEGLECVGTRMGA